MRSLRLKKRLPKDCYANLVDCDRCGIEANVEPIYEVELPECFTLQTYCITCLHHRHPEFVEVVE